MRCLLLIATILLTINTSLSAKNVFISTEGSDKNKGTSSSPFKTVDRALRVMSKGDTCFFREGVYHQALFVRNKKGSKHNKYVFMPYVNEKVQLNGTRPIQGNWTKFSDKVYSIKLDKPVWQLFANNEMLTTARWPNAQMDDSLFWNQKCNYRKMSPQSVFGTTHDQRPMSGLGETGKSSQDEGALERGSILPDNVNTQTLAETGISMKGCIAILNMGSWMTWAQTIDTHIAGTDMFTYSTDFYAQSKSLSWGKNVNRWCTDQSFWNMKNQKHGQGHYYIEGMQCLDQPGEWWYDYKTMMLYVIPTPGTTPEQMNLTGKCKTYNLTIKNSENIVFTGFEFFATTFRSDYSKGVTISNCEFKYPSYSKRVLGELASVEVSIFNNKNNKLESANKVENCSFHHFDGSALVMLKGKTDTIQNVLIHDGDYSCIGRALSINIETSRNTFVSRLTMFDTGSSQSVKMGDGSRASLCNFDNVGVFQSDGSPLQAGFFTSMELDHNWSHDNRKHAFRFDGHGGPPVPHSTNGTIHHNVAWNSGSYQIKGDKQLVYNNTSWNTSGMCLLMWEKMNGFHTESIAMNNLVTSLTTRWWGKVKNHPKFPGKMGTNAVGNISKVLRDPHNGDFRPIANDTLCNNGSMELALQHPTYNADNFVIADNKPDMGAYEANCTYYWIPGYQHTNASTPIPYNNGLDVAKNADLMWLKGYKSEKSHVYFGNSLAKVEKASTRSKLYMGEFESNMFTPNKLEANKTYYWRVDTYSNNVLTKGKVWKFTVRQ